MLPGLHGPLRISPVKPIKRCILMFFSAQGLKSSSFATESSRDAGGHSSSHADATSRSDFQCSGYDAQVRFSVLQHRFCVRFLNFDYSSAVFHLQRRFFRDGVVAYAWKQQLAGQAGAYAVDRTRLALKAFTDQKRRFFSYIDDDSGDESAIKKPRGTQPAVMSQQEEFSELRMRTVLDVLTELEKQIPEVKTSTYQ